MKKAKIFNWILAFTLISQLFVSSTASVVTFADGTDSVVNDLIITDANGNNLTTTTLNKGDSLTVGVESTNAMDQSVSIDIAGMELDQEATNQANTVNQVTVMYSAEAANVLVNWQTAAVAEEVTDEATATSGEVVKPLIPAVPVHKKVVLVMKANEAGSHTLSAKSTRDGVSVFATPLKINVEEVTTEAVDSSNTEEQPESEDPAPVPEAKEEAKTDSPGSSVQAKNGLTKAVSGSVEVYDEGTQTWGSTSRLAFYTDYANPIKYRMIFTTDKKLPGVQFSNNWDGGENIVWGMLDKNSEKIINSGTGSEVLSIDTGNGKAITEVEPGTYIYEFEVSIKASVPFDNFYNAKNGENSFIPKLSIALEDENGVINDVPSNKVVTAAVFPNPAQMRVLDIETTLPIAGVKGLLKGGPYDIPFVSDANGMIYLPAIRDAADLTYSIYITEAPTYMTSDNPNSGYSFIVSNSWNMYQPSAGVDVQNIRLKKARPEIATNIKFNPVKTYYEEKVTSTQIIEYSAGTDAETIHITTGVNTGLGLDYIQGSTKVIRYHGNVPTVIESNLLNSWQGDGISGYNLDYLLAFPGDPLIAGDRIELISEWVLLPPSPLLSDQAYLLQNRVVGTDNQNVDSVSVPANTNVFGVVNNAIKLDVKKNVTVKDTTEDANQKNIAVGDTLIYEIIVNAVGDMNSQINVPLITDKLPEGLIANKRNDLVVKLNGVTLSSSSFGPYNVVNNVFTLNVPLTNRLLSVSQNLAERQMIVTIEVKVGATASGILTNTAVASSQTRKDPLNDLNVWNDPIPNNSNEVVNYVPTAINLTKKAYGLDDVERTVAYVGEEFKYELIASVPANSGAYHQGIITDTLPKGINYVPGTTRISINGVEQTVDTVDWSKTSDGRDHLQVNLANPIVTGSDVRIIFNVTTDSTIMDKLQPVINTATITGHDKDNHFPPVEGKDNTEVSFGYRPGKLDATKTVWQGTNSAEQQAVKVGDTLTYKIVVENTEAADTMVRNVHVGDQLPTGLTYTPGTLKVAGVSVADEAEFLKGNINVNVGDIKGGTSVEITFDVTINAEATGSIANTAKATGTVDKIPNLPNTPVESPDKPANINSTKPEPTIKKSIDKPIAYAGDTLTYTLIIANDKTQPEMINGKVTDNLPAEVQYVPNSTVVNGTAEADIVHNYWNGNAFTMSGLTLKTGETITVTFQVTVVTTEIKTGITNTVSLTEGTSIDGTQKITDKQATAEFETVRGPGELKVVKQITKLDETTDLDGKIVADNDEFFYTLVVSNKTTTPSEIKEIQVTDMIPEGLIYQAGSLTIDAVAYPDSGVTGQKLAVTIPGVLQEGQSTTIRFKVKVTAPTKEISENTAHATGKTPDPKDPTKDKDVPPVDSNTVVSKRGPEPKIDKTIDKAKAVKGDELTYKLVITNGKAGFTGELLNGVVKDSLPAEVAYKAGTTKVDGTSITDITGMWTGQNFNYVLPTPFTGGSTVTIEFTVTVVTNEIKTDILNNATVNGTDSDGTIYDDDDNVPFETVRKPGELDIKKQIVSDKGVDLNNKIVEVGDTFLYTLVVMNTIADPSEIRDILVTDTIPTGLIYQAGSLSVDGTPITNGDSNVTGQDLSVNIGTLQEGQSKTLSFMVKVTETTKNGSKNTATTTGTVTPDPNKPTEETKLPPVNSNTVVSNRAPDPEFKKTISKSKAVKGDELTYKLVLTNGTAEYTGDLLDGVVKDSLPAEVVYKAGTTKVDGTSITDITGMWTGQNFNYVLPTPFTGGSTITIEFTVTVVTDEIKTGILNTATVNGKDSNGKEYPLDSLAEFETLRGPGELAINKKITSLDGTTDINNKTILVGDEFVYTLVVTNTTTTPSEIRNTLVTDAIPEGLLYKLGTLSVDGLVDPSGDNAVTGQNLSLNVGTLLEGQSKTISFIVRVTEATKSVSHNSAKVAGTVTPDPNKPTEEKKLPPVESNTVTSHRVPEPTIVKTLDKKQASKNDELTYKLVIANGKADFTGDLLNGVVTDSLPAEVTYKAGTTKVDGVGIPDTATMWNGQNFTYTLPTPFKGGSTVTIEFTVVVVTDAIKAGIINNANVLGNDNDGNSYNPMDNTEFETIRGPGQLKAEKLVMNLGNQDINGETVNENEIIRYGITVSNTEMNPSELSQVKVTDNLPMGVIYQPGTLKVDGVVLADSNFTFQDGRWLLAVTLDGTLQEGQKKVVTFDVKITKDADVKVINVAMAEAFHPNLGNLPPATSNTENVEVNLPPKPAIVKSVDKASAHDGDELTYKLVVSNGAHGGVLTGAIASDTLPPNVEYVVNSTTLDGVAVSDATTWIGGTLSILVPDLNEGESATVAFKVKVLVPAVGTTILNTAELSNTPDHPDFPKSNEVATPVYPLPGKLTATKEVTDLVGNSLEGQIVAIGEQIRYTIVVKNSSEAHRLVEDVLISDAIPAEVSYVVGTLTLNGITIPDTHIVDNKLSVPVGTLKGGELATVSFDVTVSAANLTTPLVKNIATITGSGANGVGGKAELPPLYPEATFDREGASATIIKSVNKAKVKAGEAIDYQLVVTNTATLTNWTGSVQDTLPKDVEYVAGSTTVDNQVMADAAIWSNNQLHVSITDLVPQASSVVKFTVKVKAGITVATILNTATVLSEDGSSSQASNTVETVVYADPKDPASIMPNDPPNVLPKTGEQGQNLAMLGSLILLSSLSLYFVFKRKEEQEVV
ncbi:isopeptide-forming domain-containing fimbrial protein [Carnobacterium gallinarum]|uniref:isopeptide-forming domain-containing fimbrial protein n=1 Tax=Carnobacterium gallinarum TaxID=2749 RepID=UPI0005533A12|nr:isopeptide-forming domain-containing fimbrial protein [Carnobacterium gallinarum]